MLKNWSINTLNIADTYETLLTATAGDETVISNFIVANHGTSATNIFIKKTDGTNDTGFIANNIEISEGETLFIDTKIFLNDDENIQIKSSAHTSVSFIANGDIL